MLPKEIKWILVNKGLKDTAEIQVLPSEKIVFVGEKIQKNFYCYRSIQGIEKIEITVPAPDYETALLEIFIKNFNSKKPMYIHTTRL